MFPVDLIQGDLFASRGDQAAADQLQAAGQAAEALDAALLAHPPLVDQRVATRAGLRVGCHLAIVVWLVDCFCRPRVVVVWYGVVSWYGCWYCAWFCSPGDGGGSVP